MTGHTFSLLLTRCANSRKQSPGALLLARSGILNYLFLCAACGTGRNLHKAFILWRSGSLKIVVTGGAGFIGSHLCARLLQEGHEVLCVDNFITRSENNIAALRNHPHFTFLLQDVSQPFDFEAEAIFHMASPASPAGYLDNPIDTILVH